MKPRGALYCFPRLDPEVHEVADDYQLIVDLLEDQHVLVVQGTGFNWPKPDHFRIVTLPRVEDLENAVGRIGQFPRRPPGLTVPGLASRGPCREFRHGPS